METQNEQPCGQRPGTAALIVILLLDSEEARFESSQTNCLDVKRFCACLSAIMVVVLTALLKI